MTEGRIPVERRRRKPTKSGVLLSGDLIVDCALRLVGQHGPDALSVRRLGAALGCDPSAVYRYFHNTDDLLLAVADRIIGESMAGFTRSDDWVADLRTMARRIHRAYSDHPRIAAMAAYRVTRRINEVKAVETGIGLLRSAGFDEVTAVRYYAAFVDTALGHAALDASHLALPPERRAQDHSAWTDIYQSLPADTYPQLDAVREHLPLMAQSSFGTALELLLSALAAQAPR
ncbi:TetR/AcrR family transcriptional regulator [Streptomyces sp. NPDC056121]|uniref:TetR/AcrR family transcriptional regulator n=1 Tax=Streptomyces TaxID=1883 RepID=UPI001D0B9A63|nr:TetR/AcrR family transcriptional regulator C-terminal domain-containing protein [Streptomyces longhuiensis]UDM03584.1 TetR/AcrR family transcriptional regulator C-terminal domain-containing protein [Streptomyces longhuiensis]